MITDQTNHLEEEKKILITKVTMFWMYINLGINEEGACCEKISAQKTW